MPLTGKVGSLNLPSAAWRRNRPVHHDAVKPRYIDTDASGSPVWTTACRDIDERLGTAV